MSVQASFRNLNFYLWVLNRNSTIQIEASKHSKNVLRIDHGTRRDPTWSIPNLFVLEPKHGSVSSLFVHFCFHVSIRSLCLPVLLIFETTNEQSNSFGHESIYQILEIHVQLDTIYRDHLSRYSTVVQYITSHHQLTTNPRSGHTINMGIGRFLSRCYGMFRSKQYHKVQQARYDPLSRDITGLPIRKGPLISSTHPALSTRQFSEMPVVSRGSEQRYEVTPGAIPRQPQRPDVQYVPRFKELTN